MSSYGGMLQKGSIQIKLGGKNPILGLIKRDRKMNKAMIKQSDIKNNIDK